MPKRQPLILIIDDVPENIQVLLQILKRENYRFAVATDAEEAFESIKAEKPDLVLLDVILPSANGYEICKKIKQTPETSLIPVIFLTVLDEIEDILTGFEAGAVDYITKPFNESEVLARVRTQFKLYRYIKEVEELNKNKDKLLSIITHELRNPLNNILNFSSLLDQFYDKYEEDRLKTMISALYTDSQATVALVENLLLWARNQYNKLEFYPSDLSLKQVVEEIVELYQNHANKKNIYLKINSNKNIKVYADHLTLSTAIRNLISNAVKFTAEGGIDISYEQENGNALLKIKDTGKGIEPERLEKIFMTDFHRSTPGTQNEKGSGLGLLICKDFIEKNNGEIFVASKPDKGSEFTLSIPLAN